MLIRLRAMQLRYFISSPLVVVRYYTGSQYKQIHKNNPKLIVINKPFPFKLTFSNLSVAFWCRRFALILFSVLAISMLQLHHLFATPFSTPDLIRSSVGNLNTRFSSIIHRYFVASCPHLTEPVPHTFVSVNRRNNKDGLVGLPSYEYKPMRTGSIKCGKRATKYPWYTDIFTV